MIPSLTDFGGINPPIIPFPEILETDTPEMVAEKAAHWTRVSAMARAEIEQVVQEEENRIISSMQEQSDAITEQRRRMVRRINDTMWSNVYLSLSCQLITALVVTGILVAICLKYPHHVRALTDRIVSWIR